MSTLRLGIAGLGHVGCGVIKRVETQGLLRLPSEVSITGVCARAKGRERSADIKPYRWFDDPVALAADPEVDVFIELIGGADGAAKAAVEAALKAGKPVVTANKALIAHHGSALAKLADESGVDLLFEAAVAGGVPIVRALRDSLAGVQVTRVSGILNGTCNFLTTEMLASGRSYQEVLREAQDLGYAEADPELDVSGMDAAHKAAILSSIAFSAEIDFPKVDVSGVEALDIVDLKFADRLGLIIKLIAEGVLGEQGVICRVEPKAMPRAHPLAQVNGSLNTVRVEGEGLGAVTLTGPGAGAGPTASAVMGDIAKLFTAGARSAFGRADHHTKRRFIAQADTERSPWFLRCYLTDQSGALAALTEGLAKVGVSIDKLVQDSAGPDGASPIAIMTHICSSADMHNAVRHLETLDTIIGAPRFIRIEAGV